MGDVGDVMIECPNTGEPVSTGIAMDASTFESGQMSANTLGPCPACGEEHTWDKASAWVEPAS